MNKRLPSNVRFLFPSKDGISLELQEGAHNLVEEIDSIYTPNYEYETEHGGVEVLFQTPKRYLLVTLHKNGFLVTYDGANTDDSSKIEGKGTIEHEFSFLGQWLDSEGTL